MLEPIKDLEFHEHIHRYRYRNEWMRNSVTQVVQGELDEATKQRIEETKHIWAPRGTAVHGALEKHLLGQGVVMQDEYSDWIDSLLDHWMFNDAEVLAVEHRLVDPKRSLAGSFDFLLRTAKGTLCLGDLKTVGSANGAASRKPANAQLGGYLLMLADHYPTVTVDKCVTVVSGPGVVEVKTAEPQACANAWLEAWDRYEAEQDLRWGF
jgi:hypothetical protein